MTPVDAGKFKDYLFRKKPSIKIMCGTVSAAKPIKTTRIILVLKSPLSKTYKAITPKANSIGSELKPELLLL